MTRISLHITLLMFMLGGVSFAFAQSEIEPPTGLSAERFQHEIVLTWKNVADTRWEVVKDNEPPLLVATPSHTFTRLPHNRQHTFKVRAVRNDRVSEYAVLEAATSDLQKKADDPMRIPYLRTIRFDGMTPRKLPLYFNELANENARIAYKFNGVPITPVGDHLLLSSSAYKDKLELDIDEGEGRRWKIVYLISLER